ncbi:MAG: MBL fold metallo-hydrolase, partial [Lentisphaerae bacterium]|nr:MBL fold metallo-hydrolase [Lentisphaerota bacterium]
MNVESIIVGAFEVNCYLVVNPAREVWVVDPGADAPMLLERIARAGKTVRGYLLTHGHADHICGLAELLQKHPAPVLLHPADAAWAFGELNQILPYYPRP